MTMLTSTSYGKGLLCATVGVYTTPGGTQIEGEVLTAGQRGLYRPTCGPTAP